VAAGKRTDLAEDRHRCRPGCEELLLGARAVSSGKPATGPYSAVRGFGVGPAVDGSVRPVLASPGSGSVVGGQPTLTREQTSPRDGPGRAALRLSLSKCHSPRPFRQPAGGRHRGGSRGGGHDLPPTINAGLGNGNYFWRVQASRYPSKPRSRRPTPGVSPFHPCSCSTCRGPTSWDNPPDFKRWAETSAVTKRRLHRRRHPGGLRQGVRDPIAGLNVGFGSGALEYTPRHVREHPGHVELLGDDSVLERAATWAASGPPAVYRPRKLVVRLTVGRPCRAISPTAARRVGIYAGRGQTCVTAQRHREKSGRTSC